MCSISSYNRYDWFAGRSYPGFRYGFRGEGVGSEPESRVRQPCVFNLPVARFLTTPLLRNQDNRYRILPNNSNNK